MRISRPRRRAGLLTFLPAFFLRRRVCGANNKHNERDKKMSTDFEEALIAFGRALFDKDTPQAEREKLRSVLVKIIASEFGPGEFERALTRIVAAAGCAV